MGLVSIERSFQGLSVAIETVRIVKELMEIWLNEVCDNATFPHLLCDFPLYDCDTCDITLSHTPSYIVKKKEKKYK